MQMKILEEEILTDEFATKLILKVDWIFKNVSRLEVVVCNSRNNRGLLGASLYKQENQLPGNPFYVEFWQR